MSDLVYDAGLAPWQEFSGNLRRNRRPMLRALLTSTVLFGAVALIMPAGYRSESELMVRLGQEYLVNADPATTSVFMERKEMVVSEAAMLSAPELAIRVMNEIGLARIYPSIYASIDAQTPGSAQEAMEKALIHFKSHLKVLPVRDSTLLSVSFSNHDPEVAAAVLSRLISDYLQMRRKHFEYSVAATVDQEFGGTRAAMDNAAAALAAFRHNNGIIDFDGQLARMLDERAALIEARDKTVSDVPAQAAQAASLTVSLAEIGTSVPLGREQSASDGARAIHTEVAKLKLRRNELALQFKENVPQLQDVDHQIGMTQTLLHSYQGDLDTRISTGRPTSYDQVEAALKQARGTMAADTARLHRLDQQITDLDRQIAVLDSRRADLERLQHEEKVTQDAFFQAAKRMSEARAHDQMLEAARPNVEVVQAPRVPYQETPTRLIVAVMGVVLGSIIAALIAYMDDLGRVRRAR
jgi:uncharacterized protein involved in exopolysaccharide biosynthesis